MVFERADYVGRDAFWVVFGIMAVTSLVFLAMILLATKKSTTLHHTDHLNHYCTWIIVSIAAIAYYAMAADSGYKYVQAQAFGRQRSIYYARYIDWALTTPLLLLDLILLGNLTVYHTARIMFCDLAMILCGLFGALLSSGYKWGFFAMGCVFMLIIFYDLLINVRSHVYARDGRLGGAYTILAIWLILLWTIYPVVWGLAEGSNTISVNAEIIWYGALDVLAKVVFGLILLTSLARFRSLAGKGEGPNGVRQPVASGVGHIPIDSRPLDGASAPGVVVGSGAYV